MSKTRDNHFVAQWHQKGFIHERDGQLCYLTRRDINLKNGETKTIYSKRWHAPAQQFYKIDLYSTFLGEELNDDIEQKLFGPIDDNGSKAVRAFLTDDQSQWHQNFQKLFVYIDAQKLRTPKGLAWIESKYPKLSQPQLMMEMQSLRTLNCVLWAEGVRELVSAEDSEVKFIISDHPVTIYNYACPPGTELCEFPNDPDISLKGSQTLFPLDKNRCLILTNLEYAQDPDNVNPLEQRTNSVRVRNSMVNTIEFINSRRLTAEEVAKVNYVIKSRAQSSVAAGKEEWLYPEINLNCSWADIRKLLLPPVDGLYRFGGEMFAKFDDGSVHYQDAFGRTTPQSEFLNKNIDEAKIGRNNFCGCGSGKKYKNCCRDIPNGLRTTWKVASIRERNLAFCNCIRDVLGLDSGKTWMDVRRELSEDQVSRIYGFYSILWPRDTDIYALLPKPDGSFRGLYTGILDVRVISENALPMAAIFDEFLIETPIVNPNNVKPEFSPIKSPIKYKYQALKDFLFMLEMEPFIGRGLVNLIPDPTEFDLALMKGMMEMAEDRSQYRTKEMFCEKDLELHYRLANEDLLNAMAMMPSTAKKQALIHQFGLSEEKAAEAVAELERHAEASPLTMLQNMPIGEGGQFFQFRMGPNYEMALFLAQVTGSALVTDSGCRWRELIPSQHRTQGIVNYPWGYALEQITSIPMDYRFMETLQRSPGQFAALREIMKSADRMVLDNDRDADKLKHLTDQVTRFISKIGKTIDPKSTNPITILSPEGGFYDSNVQRLLALSGCQHYENEVRSIYGVSLEN